MHNDWTVENIPYLDGKVAVITGANSGIGFETAKALARKGVRTIMACRNLDKAQDALDIIQSEITDAPAEIMHLDLASLASVHKFATEFYTRNNRLDILINNAGIMMVPYGVTEDGFERQLGINHLGHFALTGLLMDILLKTDCARVVNVSSNAHYRGNIDFDNLMYKDGKGYSPMDAYGRSKLANLMFTYESQRRFSALSAETIAVAAHPGLSVSHLADHMIPKWLMFIARPLMSLILQSSAMGALPTLRAAVDPDLKGGEYFGPNGAGERRGYPVQVESSRASHDKSDARQLWQISENLTGVRYLSPVDGLS